MRGTIFEHSHTFNDLAGHAGAVLNEHITYLSMCQVGRGAFYQFIVKHNLQNKSPSQTSPDATVDKIHPCGISAHYLGAC